MDLGTVFGLSGLVVALITLVYVRTQAAASRVQAEASAEQARTARRAAMLETSFRVADRAFDIRKALVADANVGVAFMRANPGLDEIYAQAGGLGSAMMLRRMLDTTQDVYLLRKEGIVLDQHWRNWISTFPSFARMPEVKALFGNAVQRGIYDAEFRNWLNAFFEGREPPDPAPVVPRES